MAAQPILQFDVRRPERNKRWLLFVKWLLTIPHSFVLMFLYLAVAVVSVIAWFAILFTARYPRSLWDFTLGVFRWSANVQAYSTWLQRDEYPPFSGHADYPVRYQLDYPERMSRWKIFLKLILVIPSVLVFLILSTAANLVLYIVWIAILITGKYPESMFEFMTGVQRWGHRISVYLFMLTDAYPPFTLENVPSPTSTASSLPLGAGGTPPALPPAQSVSAYGIPASASGVWGELPVTVPAQQPAVPEQPTDSSAETFCRVCGSTLKPGDYYCGSCGAAVPISGS